jgi:hypothetical protein
LILFFPRFPVRSFLALRLFGTSLALWLPVVRKPKMRVEESMSIQKKSLISTLKTAKKANVASEVKSEKMASMRMAKAAAAVSAKSFKSLKANTFKSAKTANLRVL